MSTAAQRHFLSIGECMGELSPADGNLLRLGFAGDTFNTAWYARKLLPAAWQVNYLTALGDDPMSADMKSFMEAQGIGTDAIRTVRGKSPGLYLITLENGERSFTYWRNDSAARQLAADVAHLSLQLEKASAIYFSGITIAILPPGDAQQLLQGIEAAKWRGAFVAFDPNYRERLWQGRTDMASLVARAAQVSNLVLPSFDDEKKAFGDRTVQETQARYASWTRANLVIKDSANGAFIHCADAQFHQPAATPLAIVDTTGAGDSFNAAFIAAHLQGKGVQHAAHVAAHISASVIGARGALVEIAPGPNTTV